MRCDFRPVFLSLLAACGSFTFGPAAPPYEAARACNDGLDNDGNGLADYPEDPGCLSELDPQEARLKQPPACANGLDDDGDGRTDFDVDGDGVTGAAEDPGCQSAADDDEFNVLLPACADGIDNDQDGLTDFPSDPQCTGRNDDDET
jgi:hypothetical protein